MKRVANWRAALALQFQQARTRKFEWGKFDCALFACDCIWAQLARDPAAAFRGRYSTEAQATALLGNGGLAAIAVQIASQFGFKEVSAGHAGRGDVVLIRNGTPQGALAIVDFTAAFAVCPGTRGLIRVRRHRWLRAWKV